MHTDFVFWFGLAVPLLIVTILFVVGGRAGRDEQLPLETAPEEPRDPSNR